MVTGMETVSPSAHRIGAALRALRRTHPAEAGDKASLALECLQAVIAELAADGVSAEDLQPLADLEGLIGRTKRQTPSETQGRRERRHGLSPSPLLLARAAAVIDLLVKAGQDESEAAQTMMRRLVAAGVRPPMQGGDARGWRRLLEWRNQILHGVGSEEARHEYRAFTLEIETIPPSERVSRVLDGRLWDRRLKPR
jgi:hypothetical protein